MLSSLTSYKQEATVPLLSSAIDKLGSISGAENVMAEYKVNTDNALSSKFWFHSYFISISLPKKKILYDYSIYYFLTKLHTQ